MPGAARRAEANVFFVASDCHPQTIEVVRTRAEPLGIEVKVGCAPDLMKGGDYFGVLAQYPSTTGLIHDMRPFVEQAHARRRRCSASRPTCWR